MTERRRVQKHFTLPSLTKQSFGSSCDLNVIVRNFVQTGTLPQKSTPPRYGVQEADFQEAQFALASAKSTFEGLSPEVREKYGDLHGVLTAMQDPARASELVSDGILYETEGDIAPQPSEASTEAPASPADTERSDGDAVASEASSS